LDEYGSAATQRVVDGHAIAEMDPALPVE